MIDREIKAHYLRLRALGWRAQGAIQAARTRARFDALKYEGLVKLEEEPDSEPYDLSYVDTWTDEPKKAREAYKREVRKSIDAHGVWGLVAYWRRSEEDEWIQVDSCWGFLGNELEDNGYDDDLRRAAIDAFEDDLAEQAAELAGRATYAGF